MTTVGFVGAGNMARALASGLAGRADGDPLAIVATDPDAAAVRRFSEATGGHIVGDLDELARTADVILLAVKPQTLPAVLPELRPRLRPGHLVVSIAAGVTLARLAAGLGGETKLVRAMPNTPALVGAGISVLVAGPGVGPEDLALARRILGAAGRVVTVEEEGLLDAVTAVSGSGPGFVFAFAEAWLAGAEAVGLPSELARELVRQTLLGSALLWERTGEDVGRLRAQVTSRGGTTAAGLAALEEAGFARAVAAAIESATRRSRELSAG